MCKHLQRLFLLAAMVVVPWVTQAQSLSDYTLTTDTTTFTSIASTGTAISLSSTDDGQGTCTLPFAFNFGESSLNSGNTLSCSANGFICLTGTASGTTGSYSNASQRVINAMLNQDAHMGRNSGAGVYYQLDSAGGVQCFTIEYHLLARYSTPYGAYSFQVKLYSNGNIEFIYDSVNIDGASPTFRTYLWDGPEGDLAVVTGPWANPTFGITNSTRPTTGLPAHGLRYTFTRPFISCPKPINLTFSNVSIDGATMSWTEPGTATEWWVGVTDGDTLIESIVTSPTFTVTGLESNTIYTGQVRSICAADDTSLYANGTFRTLCTYLTTLPYTQDFEQESTGSSTTGSAFVPCWERLNNGTSYGGYPYVSSSSTYNHTPGGTKGLYWYASTTMGTYGDYHCIALPGVDTTLYPVNTLQLTFWAKASSTSYHPEFQIGVMSDPTDITTFQLVSTVNVEGTTFTQFECPLSSFTGSGAHVAIKAVRPTSAWYAYVDDITLDLMPSCPTVSNLTVDSVSQTDVVLSWHENGSATEWLVSYYAGTTLVEQMAYDTLFTVSSLTPNTPYTFYVNALCSGSDTSNAAEVMVRTNCGLLATLPYTEDFEGANTGSSTNPDFAPCWHRLNNGTSYFGYPYVSSSSTYNHTSGGTNGLYWYCSTTSGSYGDYQCIVFPELDTTVITPNALQVRFWARSSSTSYNPVFQLGVMTDPTDITTFTQVATINVGGNTTFTEYITELSSYTGYGSFVALKAERGTSAWYAYVDDLTLEHIPVCPQIADLEVDAENTSTTSAYVTWNPFGGMTDAQEYDVEVDSVNSTGSPTTYTATEPHYLLTGLTPATEYKVRVRANCYSDGYGDWDSVTFNTGSLGCAQFDTSTLVNAVMGTGTSQTSGVPVNSAWGNTMCQTIFLASELVAQGFNPNGATITDITYNWTTNSSYAKEFTIYMNNSTKSTYSGTSSTEWVATGASAMVYTGPHPLNTTGAVTYHLTTPFYWDGVSNLVITTTMNQPSGSSHSSSGFYGLSTSGSSTRTLYKYQDSNPLDGSNPGSISASSTSSYRPSVTLRSATCTAMADCAAPLVMVTRVGGDEVDLAWAPGYQETSWTVQYRTITGSWHTELTSTSLTNYTFTGLTPATTYEFRVGAECSGTTEYTTVTVMVPCLPMAVPFTEDFESFSTSTADPLPTCWYKKTNYSTNYPYASTGYNHSGGSGRSMYMYSTSTTYSYMVLPLMQPAIDSLEVSFWLYRANTSYTHALQVGVIEDPDDPATFTAVGTATPSMSSAWEFFAIPLNTYTGTGQYIAIMSPNGVYAYPYLDDLTVDYIPACPRLTTVNSRNLGEGGVTLYWPSRSDVTEYVVEYGPQGFPAGFGTLVSTSDDSIRVTSLASMTAYEFRVSAVCSTGDTSPAKSVVVMTPCGNINVLPFRQDFEFCNTGSSTTGSAFVDCWTRLNNGTSYGGYPYVSSSSTYNHTPGGTKGLYWYASTTTGTYGDYHYVVLPPMDTTVYPISGLQLSFWARSSSTSYNPVFYIGVMSDPTDTGTFQQVGVVNINGNTTWTEYTTGFEGFTGVGRYLAVKAVRPTSTWYAYVDDFKVDVIPDCPAVSDMTVSMLSPNGAQISWTEEGDATSWTVEYGPAGFILGTGTQTTASADSIYLTGLVANTQYEVYVIPDCASGVGGSNSIIFSTACEYMTQLPFTEDFESAPTGSSTTGSAFVDCWTRLNNGTSYGGYPYVSSSTTYNHTTNGTRGLYWYNTTTTGTYGDYQCIVLPGIDSAAFPINTLQLSFWARSSSTSYNPNFQIGVMTDPTDINSFQLVANVNVGNSTVWDEYVTSFADFAGSGCHLAIKAIRSSSWYCYVDDIKVELAPDCPRVENIVVSNITDNSAYISWTEMGDATSWSVIYGPQGFTPSLDSAETVSDPYYSFMGLLENTAYDVYVVPDCPDGQGGMNMVSFRTDCLPIPHEDIPYVEDFESYTASTSGTIDPCWRKGNMGVSNYYPYVSSSYHASGSKSLYFYGYNSSYYSYVTLPTFEDSLNHLLVTFKLLKTSSTYGGMTVGIMTNPADISTFQAVATVQAEATSTWEEFTVPFGNYQGTGHITFLQNSTYYTYLDDVVVDFLPDCPPVSNLDISNVNSTSAYLTWGLQPGVSDNVPEEYEIEVYDNSGTTVATATDTNMYFFITGLQALTQYTAKVRASCGSDGYGEWDSISFNTPCLAGGNIPIIGNGTTTTTYYLPLNNFYNYSYSQQIVLSSEMNGPTTLYGVRFNYAYTSSVSSKSNCTIYVGHTTLSTLSTSNFVDPSTLTAVYTGNMNVHNGWNEFTFSTPFSYNGTDNLVIAVDDNSGDYDGSSYVYNAYNCGSTRSMLYYSDSYNPDASSTSTLSSFSGSKTTYSYRVDMELISPCDSTATCAPPNVVVTDVDTGSITVVWGAGLDETSWELDYRLATSTTWTNIGTMTTNSYTLTGLSPNHEYQIRVGANCTDTTMYSVVSATTICAPYPLPFHENFASFSTSTADPLPNCWEKHTNYSTSYPYASTSYSMSGGRSMYMYSTSSTYTYMVLPPFDAPIDSLQVSFWLYRTNTSYTHELQVGIMTDPGDVSTFQLMGTATPTQLSTWEPFEIPLSGYVGTGQFIAIMSPNGVYSYPYLDELNVEYISSCPRVRNVSVSNIGYSSAKISWDTTAADMYQIEYGPAGFAHGSGTLISNILDDTLTITGLAASSQYDVYVRGICSPDTGNWSFSTSFFTLCASIDTLPFVQNFNSIGTGTSVHAPNCWYGYSTYSTSYPYPSTSYNRSGSGAAMYMYLYNSSGYYTMLQLPPVDTVALPMNTLQIEFSLLRSNTSYEHGVVVGICTGQGMTGFVPIDSIVITRPAGEWQDFELPLNNYTGSGNYITFLSVPGSGATYSYPYLDDVRLVPIPSCIAPDSLVASNATTTTVDLTWRERGSATEWAVEYGPVGFQLGTGTTVITNTNPVTLTGLPSSFDGQFYVRSICDVGDTSMYNRDSCRFATSQAAATIPYYIDFEDSAAWAGWQTSSNTYIGWVRGTATADSGNYSMYVSPDGGTTYGNENFSSVVNATVFRDIDFGTTTNSFTISFRAKAGGTTTNTYDALMVFLVDPAIPVVSSSANITSPWGNVNDLYLIEAVRLDTNWNTYSASFDTISGIHRVAFFWFNQNTGASYPYIGGPAAVDNIRIDYSACARPVNLAIDSAYLGSTTARLTWTGTPGTDYRVAYRVVGADPSTNVYLNATTNNITLTGLTPMTNYYAWVQKLCGTDSSLFSDNVNFQTEMCDNAVYAYNYPLTGSYTSTSYFPGYAFYNYSFTEVIIDSADLAGSGFVAGQTITAFMYNPTNTTSSDYYTDCDIYMANTTQTDLSSGFILVDTSFVQVGHNMDLSFTDVGWQIRGFDTVFTWDGSSNVVFAVNRKHGSYSSSGQFEAHTATTSKARYVYNDGSAYVPSSVTGGTATSTVPNYRLISCGAVANCPEPIITSTTTTYNSATIGWTGDGTTYQVNIKETSALDWPATDITVTGNTYTFSGLSASTDYTFRVRQDCSADSTGFSDWTIGAFTTDSLPCLPPDNLTVSDITNAQATFSWTAVGFETQWDLHVWNLGGLDTIYRVNTNPVTVGGYTAGVTYNAAIRAICGTEELEGDYGDTVTFTTQTCPDVTGLTTSNVTASSVTLNWTADPMAESWLIEYGYTGFAQGTGTSVTSDVNSLVVNGLEDETSYDFYVKAVCGDNWNSEGWTRVTATTLTGGGEQTYTVTVNVNDPAMGSATGGGTYTAGENCTVTATANEGYHFVNWSNGETANPYTFTVVANVTLTANFAANGTQGIEDVDGNAICTIYPNPTSDVTTISVSGVNGVVRIAVVDMNGRTVASETLECSSDCEKTMDVDKLAQGAYFVKITGENLNMVKKLIVR